MSVFTVLRADRSIFPNARIVEAVYKDIVLSASDTKQMLINSIANNLYLRLLEHIQGGRQ